MKILQSSHALYIVIVTVLLLLGGVFAYYAGSSAEAPENQVATELQGEENGADALEEADILAHIVPHRALYRLRLVTLQGGSPISEIGGEMYFKWEDVCDAWSTDHRFRIEYYYTDRPSVTVTNHFISWEAKTGDRMHFLSEGYTDGILDDKTRGEAVRTETGGGIANYREPVGLSIRLPEHTYFPAQHTIETIRQAMSGNSFFNAIMFDGTDDEGPSEVNAFLNQETEPLAAEALYGDNPNIDQSLLSGQHWDARLAFFPLQGGVQASSETPAYEMRVKLHENGVVSDVVVEYDKFSVRQELVALSPLPAAGC